MFYSNKSSILVSGEGNSSISKMTSFMRILNLEKILFLMCIVSSWEITCGTEEELKDKIKVEKLEMGDKGQQDFTYKGVFLGDDQVGKTQILNKHVNKLFNTKYSATAISEFRYQKYKSTINKDNSQTIRLDIWDIAGQEIHRLTLQIFAKDARAIILVYDVTKKESFDNIKKYWLEKAKEKAPEDAVYFLVGNKTDLGEEERQVSTEEAKKYAKDNEMRFFEVSAKKGDNVDELFKDIVKERLIKEKDIIKAIEKYEQKNNPKNDNNSNVNSEETAPPTPTKNKPCICCSCCPCNK